MPECEYCGKEIDKRGLSVHKKHCPENPANKGKTKDKKDKALTNKAIELMEDDIKKEADQGNGDGLGILLLLIAVFLGLLSCFGLRSKK